MGRLNMKARVLRTARVKAAEKDGAWEGRCRASTESSGGGRTMKVRGRPSVVPDGEWVGTPTGVSADDMAGLRSSWQHRSTRLGVGEEPRAGEEGARSSRGVRLGRDVGRVLLLGVESS